MFIPVEEHLFEVARGRSFDQLGYFFEVGMFGGAEQIEEDHLGAGNGCTFSSQTIQGDLPVLDRSG
jgi:hypothetical protein